MNQLHDCLGLERDQGSEKSYILEVFKVDQTEYSNELEVAWEKRRGVKITQDILLNLEVK